MTYQATGIEAKAGWRAMANQHLKTGRAENSYILNAIQCQLEKADEELKNSEWVAEARKRWEHKFKRASTTDGM